MDLFQDLVSFDVVPWYLTEQNWLNLSLNLEQQAVAYSRTVTSIGKDVPRASQTHHLLKVELRIHGHTHTISLNNSSPNSSWHGKISPFPSFT